MKVFISWSGTKSHKVGLVFRDWLPSVIQSLEPYVSSEDIDKGARWSSDIAKELEDSSFGILCVTKENIEAPWLSFEAGALSKTMDKAFVSPFLFNIKRSEVNGPILQFQSTIFQKEDIRKLLHTLNKACGESCISDERLNKAFDVWYPTLEEELNNIKSETENEEENGTSSTTGEIHSSEILEEILDLSRENQKLLRNPDTKINDSIESLDNKIEKSLMIYEKSMDFEKRYTSNKYKRMFLDEFIHTILPECNDIYGILVMLSFYKEDFPWLYYMGKELVDVLQSETNTQKKQTYIRDFRKMLEFTCEHPLMRELSSRRKENMMVIRELPYMLMKMLDEIEMKTI
ncbi:TIR domain-containing protein [[Clostridium] scindens]|uniref:TIR domain-containing protein n=1 Tax=Clostridium scindens (strain JCM 10418 / VPI 12708) TaxID=29347 RepID=UPI002675D148|nr:TIR domain-containing protein [[Clostridium] scindens]